MEEICLVEAGGYLLGIDSTAIAGRFDVETLARSGNEERGPLLFLAAFLNRGDIPEVFAGYEIVEVKTEEGSALFFLVDRIVGEAALPGDVEDLPGYCPEPARQCCPRLTVLNGQIVLLLSPEGLGRLVSREAVVWGSISWQEFCGRACKPRNQQEEPTEPGSEKAI